MLPHRVLRSCEYSAYDNAGLGGAFGIAMFMTDVRLDAREMALTAMIALPGREASDMAGI